MEDDQYLDEVDNIDQEEEKEEDLGSREFWMSKKGREIERSRMTYVPVFAKDGSFRIPNVPAGRYEFIVEVHDPAEERFQSRSIGTLKKDVVVTDGTEAMDIGTFELVMTPPRTRPTGRTSSTNP